MDEQQIKKLWEKTISAEELVSGDPQATYKGESIYSGTFLEVKNILETSQHTMILEEDTNTHGITEEDSLQTVVDDDNHTMEMSYANNSSPKTDHGYKIVEEIARGGMGVIFRGYQSSLQREVAIKKILPSSQIEQQKHKFIAESMVTAYLDHPNIVPVHDLVINEKNEVLLSMKLVKGTAWKELIYNTEKSVKKYDLQAHLEILLSVCNAIAYAHSKSIVHNDLKPSNIMVGEFGEVLVMDWGIAVDISSQKSTTRAIHKSSVTNPMGTPSYMSSELAEGRGCDIGPWTDVYLLGAMLYEILMLRPPHSGMPFTAILEACQGKKPLFSEKIPQELKQICLKAMEKNPCDRYQNAIEFRQAIQDFLLHKESLLLTEKASEMYDKSLANINTTKGNAVWEISRMLSRTFAKLIFPYWLYSLSKKWATYTIFWLFLLCLCYQNFFTPEKLDVIEMAFSFLNTSFLAIFWIFLIAIITNLASIAVSIFRYTFRHSSLLPKIKIKKQFVIDIYDQIFQAIALYQRAIDLWENNDKAKEKKLIAHTKLAEIAINNNEVRLARLQISYIKQMNPDGEKKWRSHLHAAEVEQKAEYFMSWLAKALFIFMFAVIVILYVSGGF